MDLDGLEMFLCGPVVDADGAGHVSAEEVLVGEVDMRDGAFLLELEGVGGLLVCEHDLAKRGADGVVLAVEGQTARVALELEELALKGFVGLEEELVDADHVVVVRQGLLLHVALLYYFLLVDVVHDVVVVGLALPLLLGRLLVLLRALPCRAGLLQRQVVLLVLRHEQLVALLDVARQRLLLHAAP